METKKKTSLKTNKKPKKSSKAKQIDNVKRSPEEKRRQLMEEIIEKTGLGENEILEAEEKFKDDFPDGRISLEEFIDQSDVSIETHHCTQLTKRCGLYSWGRTNQRTVTTCLPLFLEPLSLLFIFKSIHHGFHGIHRLGFSLTPSSGHMTRRARAPLTSSGKPSFINIKMMIKLEFSSFPAIFWQVRLPFRVPR